MKRWLVLGMVLALSACGSVKVRDVNEAEVMKVKKVAVASFSFEQPKSSLDARGPSLGEENEDAGASLRDISAVLAKRMHWSVMSADEMRNNEEYKKVYESKMKGWQSKMGSPDKLLIAPGVMDAQSLRRMKTIERDALMAALGVDALVEAWVHISFATKGVTVMGIGDRYPQATASVWMYKRGVDKPVWFDGHIVGEPSAESVGKTGFWDASDVTRLGRLSAKSAFEKVSLKQEQM